MRRLPRGLLICVLVAAALTGCATDTPTDSQMEVTSDAFDDGASIPTRYTCDGEDVSPQLSVAGLPEATETWGLVVDDPDAPGQTFTHWLIWNLPADRTRLPEDVPSGRNLSQLGDARQGENDAGSIGYKGPCPPEGDDAHTYRFTAFALETTLDLDGGASREDLENAVLGYRLTGAELTATYAR